MKKYIYLFAILSLVILGCSEQSSILAPDTEVANNQLNWIALPQSQEMSVENSYSVNDLVTGLLGDNMYINKTYKGGPYGRVTIEAKATFPMNSFNGIKLITMTIDDRTCTATFSPSMVFNKPVVYNVTFTGVDLSAVDASKVRFAYLASNGSIELASNEGVTVDPVTGTLKVKNAKIPHFSRYGFVN